jgi:hypothetical protein
LKNIGLHPIVGGFNRCEGDCDTDNDCKPGLKCFHGNPIPGCVGTKYQGSWDYCIPI